MGQRVICFHNPDEENGYLSNWYKSEFKLNGTRFISMEQYMMACKAFLFGDRATLDKIMSTSDNRKLKALGRQVDNYSDLIWGGRRQVIVYRGIEAKFVQNKSLYEKLINTGNSVLAECAVKDRIWGIGLSMNNPDRFNVSKWRGRNLLGFTLMEVRDHIR